ncbi:glycoside hydrolase family 113 [Engelhardtia mirabilis]|uniref:GTA TIM-barrel-like domain-containing protein n=1 Tax=Engelhardtia mirabilis TaxID=2528011 RepID=A0A518BN01_9BACT|nr:hypothetical protein Pla133_34090 [Planctomycetes bacterium Pla133]QDV02639.1 hypothetical protein Pla86_34080 [Planctomycetes bacterium Pla86]
MRRRIASLLGLVATLSSSVPSDEAPAPPAGLEHVRGMTVSCHGSGQSWASDEFAAELDELLGIGCNWIAIHPYASIGADGEVRWREIDPEHPPEWLARPLREARDRGIGLLIKPHLAYWGSPFAWRGEIDFEPGPTRERFWTTYSEWIRTLARTCSDADGFVVGTELGLMEVDEERWRELIDEVRALTDAPLTYAANWDRFESLGFWDALDAVGVQAYFPLAGTNLPEPAAAELTAAWEPWIAKLRAVHERTGKPVVLTELGYPRSLVAAVEPWASGATRGPGEARACALQERCLGVALARLGPERDWLRGAFLWKCFPGQGGWAHDGDFAIERPELRAVVQAEWGRRTPPFPRAERRTPQ